MPTAVVDRLSPLIDECSSSSDLIELLRGSVELSQQSASAEPSSALVHELLELATVDRAGALVAIEALARVSHPDADSALLAFLHDDVPAVARHASWRLASRRPQIPALVPLVHRLNLGGIDTMHAHRTLRRWSSGEPGRVLSTIRQTLPTVEHATNRARLVELVGVIDHPTADADLLLLARDGAEAPSVRSVAVAALGHRATSGSERLLRALACSDGELGLLAAIALDDARSRRRRAGGCPNRRGLTIAQLTLAGELDRNLTSGGQGDTGGVASLVVSLGDALAQRPEIDRVLTIGRGSLDETITDHLIPASPSDCSVVNDDNDAAAGRPDVEPTDGHVYARVCFGDADRPAPSASQAWEHLPAIERSLGRVLDRCGPVDLLHLRMADVGTLAGFEMAERLGIDVCFSLAPDPHGLIQSLQSAGRLDRSSFVEMDTTEHLWFRARLVERLARRANKLALFPRRRTESFFEHTASPEQAPPVAVVVPEGIDLAPVRRAEAKLARPRKAPGPAGHDILADLAARIPESRRHLPLLLSVGRLSPVKGMDRLARSWAAAPRLHQSCTLVIVGGSLDQPSAVERTVLDALDEAVPCDHPSRSGMVLLGGRPRSDVSLLLAATATGHEPGWAPGGIYANGSYKEEFGLALIEAMAAGLVVVAPSTGGPPTYVDHGDTGLLVGPGDDLGAAVHRAFALVDRPGRSERARQLVEERYSIDGMVDRLVELYQAVPSAPVST